MPITDWPKSDQPREKLFTRGEQILTDAELIAIFINTGSHGKTALDLARELLATYGNLKKIVAQPIASLLKTPGLGKSKVITLKAAAELGRRFLNVEAPIGTVLNNSRKTQQYLVGELREQTNEVFACIYLDNRFRVLSFEKLFEGTIHSTNIYPRQIVKRGLFHNAAKIILAHNHPSGNPLPSQADKEATRQIKQALALVDIDVVDHIIIGGTEHFSFAETGLLMSCE